MVNELFELANEIAEKNEKLSFEQALDIASRLIVARRLESLASINSNLDHLRQYGISAGPSISM